MPLCASPSPSNPPPGNPDMADPATNAVPPPVEATPPSGGDAPAPQLGRVIRVLPFSLSAHNDVTIGSNHGCDVVIEGADPLHATLRWENGGWVVYDDPAPMDTLVNGESVQSRKLEPGDWLEIAGIRIRFDGEQLSEIPADAPVGLRVTARHVSATVGKKRFGVFPGKRKRLLDDISFETAPGKFVAILGPSGSGKSTLIQRMAGLADYGGSLRLNGHEISAETASLLPLTAYLPQAVEATFHDDMRMEAAMEDFSRVYLGGKSPENWAEKAFGQVGLDWKAQRGMKIRDLSGGQKRRLALVLALQRNPQLLLLDEPTAGLDPAAEAGVMDLLKTLAGQGRTVFCSTHVLGSLDLCDEVLVLDTGRQAFYGNPEEALRHFGADGWLDVYRKLETGGWEPETTAVPEEASQKPLPPAPAPVTFRAAFRGTFLRLLRGWFGWGWLLPVVIPLLVAVVLAWSCGVMFQDERGDKQETVCFCMAVAVFWMGLSGSVRALVSERVPKRCLDRMRGMPLSGYFAGHVTFVAATAVVQTLLFLSVIFPWHHAKVFSACAAPAFWAVLSLASFAGGCVGLSIGAWFKKELHAVMSLPLMAILALFLSKPVLEEDGKPAGWLRAAECCAPTLRTQECLYGELERHRVDDDSKSKDATSNWWWFLVVNLLCYPAAGLFIAFQGQKKREEEWDGR